MAQDWRGSVVEASEMLELKKKIDEIHHIIIGNGEPEKSLVFKVAQHSRFIGFWEKFGWAVILSGLTVPPGVVTVVILNLVHVK